MTLSYVTKMAFLALCFCVISPLPCRSTEIICALSERSYFDDSGISIVAFFKAPREKLILPEIKAEQKWFLEMGAPRPIVDGDRIITAMIIIKDDGDLIYLDRNNDEDLTNDGEPIFFPLDENDLRIFKPAAENPDYKNGALFQRKPKSPSGRPGLRSKLYNTFVDDEGNVLPIQVQMWSKYFTDFEGKVRTFYYYASLELSRGIAEISGREYQIALHDANFNGRFNDSKDRLIVDIDGDGINRRRGLHERFKLTDVFQVGSKNYKLSQIDPQGRSLHIVEADEEPISLFRVEDRTTKLERSIARKNRIQAKRTLKLNPAFWDIQFETIDGDSIRLADYKGSYLLLNFWGEWCAPCIKEIPTLVKARQEFPESKMVIIGMLKTRDLSKARQMIHDLEITWPQVQLKKEISELFDITGYPTNIFIRQDGETYLERGYVEYKFFEENIE